METLNNENNHSFDIEVIKAIEAEYGKDIWKDDNAEFTVGTDEQADEAHEDYLETYIDDCLEIPDNISMYFDREAWKRDARIMSSRGNDLNFYDGKELTAEVGGETIYIYRKN